MPCACSKGTSRPYAGSLATTYVLRNETGTYEFDTYEEAVAKRDATGGVGVITRRN